MTELLVPAGVIAGDQTITSNDDKAAGQPTSAVGDSNETTVVPPPTWAVPDNPETTAIPDRVEIAAAALAWSQDDDQEEPGRSWRSAASRFVIPLFIAATAAFAAATVGWAWVEMHRSAPALAATSATRPVNAKDELPSITGTPDATPINSGPSTFVMSTATAEHLVPPPPPVPESTPDDDFLRLLREDGFVVYDAAQVELIGRMSCANLAVTHNIYQTHLYVHNVLGVADPNADEIALAASTVYCPDTPY
jgi:Protein of unknown function (DUF732)